MLDRQTLVGFMFEVRQGVNLGLHRSGAETGNRYFESTDGACEKREAVGEDVLARDLLRAVRA